jgi:hypothetical protein
MDGIEDNCSDILPPPTNIFTFKKAVNVNKVLHPANIENASFLTTSMKSFLFLEHREPGLGIANLVRVAIGCPEDASVFTPEEVEFHINGCRFVGDLSRTNIQLLGSYISEIHNYYEDSHVSRSAPSILDPNIFTGNVLQRILASDTLAPNFDDAKLEVIRRAILSELTIHEETIHNGKHVSDRRGVFLVSRPPKDSNEIFRWYLTGANSIYQNLPCPEAYMTDDHSYAVVVLEQLVSIFIGLGIDPMYVPPSTSPFVSSYHHSPSAVSVYNDVQNLSRRSFNGKVVTLFLKTWGDDAEKNNTRTNILSFNIQAVTFMCVFGNGDFRYYCFLLSLGMKGGDLDVVESIMSQSLAELRNPHEYYQGNYERNIYASVHLIAAI